MNFIRSSILVMAATSTMACVVSKKVTLVENADPSSRPEEIEVTSRGGVYVVHWPVVVGDSLRGWQDRAQSKRVAFAVSDVQRATVRQVSGGRTAAAVGLGLVAAFGIWLLLILSSGGIAPSY
jgi:hypothetical protein